MHQNHDNETEEEPARRKGCTDKIPYPSEEAARAAAAYANWQYGEREKGPVPYPCRWCDRWHLARRSSQI